MANEKDRSGYGLRKRDRESVDSENQERPSKTRPGRVSRNGFAEFDNPAPGTKGKPKSKLEALEENKAFSKTYYCHICTEEVVASHFPHPANCPQSCIDCLTRDERICNGCIISTIIAQLETRDLDKLGCPSCNTPWQYRYLAYFLPPAEVVRLDVRVVNRGIAKEDNWRWCAYNNCNYGEFYEMRRLPGEDRDYCHCYNCTACHRPNCFKHQIPWHHEFSCAQYDYRREHERVKAGGLTKDEMAEQDREALRLMQAQQTRICPYCGNAVQKSYGCDNMHCKSK